MFEVQTCSSKLFFFFFGMAASNPELAHRRAKGWRGGERGREMNSPWHTVGHQEMTHQLEQDGLASVRYCPDSPTRLGAPRGQGPWHPAQGLAPSRCSGKAEEHVADESGAWRNRGARAGRT